MDEKTLHTGYLKDLLMAEHSKAQTLLVTGYISGDEIRFASLMDLFFSAEPKLNQRAAWALPTLAADSPELFIPYFEKLLDNLENASHNAVVRNTLRALQETGVPETLQGKAVNICMKLITDARQPVAVRVFAMNVTYSISRGRPELQRELRLVIETISESGSAGLQARCRNILKEMEK